MSESGPDLSGLSPEELRQALERLALERHRLERELAGALGELDESRQREQGLAAELGAVAARLRAVESSLTWRLARGVLDPLDRLTRPFRKASPGPSEHEAASYAQWIEDFDTPDQFELRRIRSWVAGLAAPPHISVLVPVYNPTAEDLRACLDSVLEQLYPHWQLCLADDASTQPHVREILEQYAANDERIQVVYRQENGHIVRASNSALELADGEFLALLDHDDVLAPTALAHVAAAALAHPRAGLFYSDEDKLDADGKRSNPYFKPAFNWDLFLGQNLLNHLTVYRTELVREVGGFRPGFEGSQDYDLALRVLERLDTDTQVVHIPFVLYHWRAAAGSTAGDAGAKSYAQEAARKAVAEHLERTGQTAAGVRMEPTDDGMYQRIVRPLPEPAPLVSLVMPSTCAPRNAAWIKELLATTAYPALELVLVANNLPGPEARAALDELATDPRVTVVDYEGPFNFPTLCNLGVEAARGELVALINDDVTPEHPDWLAEMAAQALRPEVGAIGALLHYPDGRIQHGGILLGIGSVAGHAHKYLPCGSHGYFSRARLTQEFSAVTAACLVLRREVYDEVEGLDPVLAVAFNDVDFCLRIRQAGHHIVWTPFARLVHHESVSRGDDQRPEKLARFHGEMRTMQTRWGRTLLTDPFLSPNLSLYSEQFQPAAPPRTVKPWEAARATSPVEVHLDEFRPQSGGRVRISGWVAAEEDILSLEIPGCAAEDLVLVQRFDVVVRKFHYPHVLGFRAELCCAGDEAPDLVVRTASQQHTCRPRTG